MVPSHCYWENVDLKHWLSGSLMWGQRTQLCKNISVIHLCQHIHGMTRGKPHVALFGTTLASEPQGKDPTEGWTSDLGMISCLEGATNIHSILQMSWKANYFPKRLPFELVSSLWKIRRISCVLHMFFIKFWEFSICKRMVRQTQLTFKQGRDLCSYIFKRKRKQEIYFIFIGNKINFFLALCNYTIQ